MPTSASVPTRRPRFCNFTRMSNNLSWATVYTSLTPIPLLGFVIPSTAMPQPRLPGVRFVFESRAQAIASARAASGHASTANDIRMVVFCDGSLDQEEIHGGIAVTHHPWLPVPSLPPRPASARGLTEVSRPVDFIFDSMLTEAIALCQAQATIVNEIVGWTKSPGSRLQRLCRVVFSLLQVFHRGME
ncbi:hypothetical protein QBC37DRAFT_14330 [Rhypophila decipiens]|uniref:Uncharacterized protein n=1 Tax=Rhypophila decipiens TaxID=261697 RepID=A0AAN6Y754_9PEZI|nr:hypothetical protein QBC37DRAFT_14330 [Rhypophila decipiens]